MLDLNRPPSFEQSLARLQQLVDQLEDGQLTLGQSLAAYEEGIKHLQVCHAALTDTERKIEVLSGFNAAGEPITRVFNDAATHSEETAAPHRREPRRARNPAEESSARTVAPTDSELDDRRELF